MKLQALVRGRMVRKQATETLRRMHALVKAQERARAFRLQDNTVWDSNSNHSNLVYVYDDTTVSESISMVKKTLLCSGDVFSFFLQSESKLKWLKNWMEEEAEEAMNGERNAKILEMDSGKPKIRNQHRRHHQNQNHDHCQQYSVSSDQNYSNSRSSFMTFPAASSVTSPSSVSTRQKYHRNTSSSSSSLPTGIKGGGPNYMTYTESSRAKSRSQSAPRQRSQSQHCIKRVSSTSFTKFASTKAYPGSRSLDKMGMSINT